MKLVLKSVDSVEFAVESIDGSSELLARWGFKRLAEGRHESTRSELWGQGKIRLVLSEGKDESSYARRFVLAHGDGICDVAFEVDDAFAAAELAVSRGAKAYGEPKKAVLGKGEVKTASLAVFGDVTHTFVSRAGTTLFSTLLPTERDFRMEGVSCFGVDHLTVNVGVGEMEPCASFYEKVFEFKNTRSFNISTGRTGLVSKVMENDEGTVKIPINEPTDPKSQIQEYLNINRGAGVQHLALTTDNIIRTLGLLRERGQKFLDVPDTYYDEVPGRVPNIKEDLNILKRMRILCDGDASGYLLQIFSENTVGPFFFELIQRAGNKGFGEGNFRALFEAIERDQEKRGVL